jgi:cell wall assembly regulator SMI1
MDDKERVNKTWQRLRKWLSENFPPALENLRDPATEEAIAALESQIQMVLPNTLKESFKIHDGEMHHYPPGVLADGYWLMPLEQAFETWKQLKDLAAELFGTEDNPTQWRSQVEDGIICIKGAVKPLIGSPKWFPIANMNGDIIRFLDFAPPDGGTVGQIIEIDAEACQFQVIAPSFLDYLEQYAADLEAGRYVLKDGYLQLRDRLSLEDLQSWGVPEYLQRVDYDRYDPKESSDAPIIAELADGEEVTIVGAMGSLMGGSEKFFSLRTEAGQEYTCLAQPNLTKGYGAIAVRQNARIRATKNTGQVESVFAQYHGKIADLIVLEYTMLR